MTRHNFIQRRSRLLKQIRDASTAYLWHMNALTPQGRRACTLASRRLSEYARDLHRLGTTPKGADNRISTKE